MALITIKIERPVLNAGEFRERHARRHKVVAVACASVAAAAFLVDPFSASATVVPIAPHAVWNNTVVGPNSMISPVVSGGSTTVPTDATRVQFSVSATNEQRAGQLVAYPAGNPAGSSGHVLTFAAKTPASSTFTELVGLGNKVTFWNQSPGAITLTVKITGYSTEVRAADVSGAGGSVGDVLTNTGGGASWQPLPIQPQQTPGHAWATQPSQSFDLTIDPMVVATLTVPSGNYVLMFSAMQDTNQVATTDGALCKLLSPSGNVAGVTIEAVGPTEGNTPRPEATFNGQGLITTTGGQITVSCRDFNDNITVSNVSLIASQVGAADGDVTP